MKLFQVRGEYGPTAFDSLRYLIRAKNSENAKKRAIRDMKKTDIWDRIGEHNVYVSEVPKALNA